MGRRPASDLISWEYEYSSIIAYESGRNAEIRRSFRVTPLPKQKDKSEVKMIRFNRLKEKTAFF